MPNLKSFTLFCCSIGIDEDLYNKFIQKLLLKGLDEVNLDIQNDENDYNDPYFSKEELMKLSSNIYFDINKINIRKLKCLKK